MKNFKEIQNKGKKIIYGKKILPRSQHVKSLKNQLEKNYTFYSEREGNYDKTQWDLKIYFVDEIRNWFHSYFCRIFGDYKYYLKKEKDLLEVDVSNDITKIFYERSFLNKCTKSDFYKEFVETRYWIDFLEKVWDQIPSSIQDQAHIKTFNETSIFVKKKKGLK